MDNALSAAPVDRLVRLPLEPLRFTDANIAAISDERKTQTRRPIKPMIGSPYDEDVPHETESGSGNWHWHHDYEYDRWTCRKPKYKIGDEVVIANKDGDPAGVVVGIWSVEVERLQEITEEDAKAEGVRNDGRDGRPGHIHRELFRDLWATIYGPDNQFAWERNPWVWVYEFRVLDFGGMDAAISDAG